MANRESLNKLKVDALKKLCEESDIPTTGKRKAELISSLLTHQAPRESLVPVVQTALTPCISLDLPPFPQVLYTAQPISDLPRPSFTSIYNFLIVRTRQGESTQGESCHVENFKALDRAVQHFDAGDIQNIKVSQINTNITYVKAQCLASMKQQKYDVYLCLKQTPPSDNCCIEYAYCQCPVGLAQSCSHIGGLLVALNRKERLEGNATGESCTSQLCQWVVPRQEKAIPKPVAKLNLAKPSIDGRYRGTVDFDPRHSSQRETDSQYMMDQLKQLQKIAPEAGILQLWNTPIDAPEHVIEEEVTTFIDPRQLQMEKMIFTSDNVPPVTIDQDLVSYIERQTREQRACEIWRDLHRCRITSSTFGSVLRAGSNPSSLVKQIIEGSGLERYTHLPAAIQWGLDHEEQAREEYLLLKNQSGGVQVERTGLTLCSMFSYLGASADGRVLDEGAEGVLEIKCPYSIKGTLIKDMEVQDIINMNDPSFCLENSQNGPTLRRSHPYFAQVQGEMSVMGLPWCDFVLWTGAESNNIFIERVHFDEEFVKEMFPKLVAFFVNHILPNVVNSQQQN